MAFQINGRSIVCSIAGSGEEQINHHSSALTALWEEDHQLCGMRFNEIGIMMKIEFGGYVNVPHVGFVRSPGEVCCLRAVKPIIPAAIQVWAQTYPGVVIPVEDQGQRRREVLYVCMCVCIHVSHSIKINNNKHVYRQIQERKPTGSVVECAKCWLIIGTDYWVKVFASSSIAQSVCQRAFRLLEIRFESCIQQRNTTCLLSIRKSLACAKASELTPTTMYVCM